MKNSDESTVKSELFDALDASVGDNTDATAEKARVDAAAQDAKERESKDSVEESYRKDTVKHLGKVYKLKIQFAWGAFALVALWLVSCVIFVYSAGAGKFPIAFSFVSMGTVFVCCLGLILGCAISGWSEQCNWEWLKKITCKPDDNIRYFPLIMALVCLVGFVGFAYYPALRNCNCVEFNLSDSVIIAYITTTTASVIGILAFVMKWLFPAGK